MGTVFLAETEEGTPVVLKTPSLPTADLRARMGDEARIGFRLRHPHIVRTLDYFDEGDKPVLVIEYVDGPSMQVLRDRFGKMPPAMVARIGEQLSDALSTLHHLKDDRTGEPLLMLHRDVTPGNIVIGRDGDAKLIDLGIARSIESEVARTAAGVLRGTFRYLSPDLFVGKPYSWMTDLWSLGVSLFEGALGRRSNVAGSPAHAMRDILAGRLTELLPGEELNPMLRFLFDGLLAVEPADRRFRDPEEVLHAFRVLRGRLGDGLQETQAMVETAIRYGLEVDGPAIAATGPDDATEVRAAPPVLVRKAIAAPVSGIFAATTGRLTTPAQASAPAPIDLAPTAAPVPAEITGITRPPRLADLGFDVDATVDVPVGVLRAPAPAPAGATLSDDADFEASMTIRTILPIAGVRPPGADPNSLGVPPTDVLPFRKAARTSVEEAEDRRSTLSMPMRPVDDGAVDNGAEGEAEIEGHKEE